ncbi:MAG: AAA family ATPase [Gammaproteobacteria bacterium]|nr:AAA family ATPase [Gammaproteobacteria bacterium]
MESTLQLSLGLEGDPFGSGPAGSSYFFASPAISQRLDTLHHLTQFSDHLLVLLGVAGAGKSSLLEEFLRRSGPHWHVCYIDQPHGMALDALLARMLESLEIDEPYEDAQDALTLLANALESAAARGELFVLAVDDADALTGPALALIVELSARSEHLKARVLLSAPRGFLARLTTVADEAGVKESVYAVEVPALELEHTGEYIDHRLKAAGLSRPSPFSDEVVAAIHETSGGHPAAINRLALETLAKGEEPAVARTPAAPPPAAVPARLGLLGQSWRWIAGAAVAAVCLLAVFLGVSVFGPDSPSEPVPRLAQSDPAGEVKPTVVPVMPPPPKVVAVAPPKVVPELPKRPIEAPPAVVMPAPKAPPVTPPPVASPAQPAPTQVVVTPPLAVEPSEPALTAKVETVPPAPPAPPPLPRTVETPVEKAPPASSPVARTPATEAPAKVAAVAPKVPRPAPKKITVPPPRTGTPRLALGRDWIDRQPSDSHTIQLLGTHNFEALQALVAREKLGGRAAAYRSIRQGRAWYGLIYGAYPTRAAALAAAKSLNSTITKGAPWVRPFRDIQASLP